MYVYRQSEANLWTVGYFEPGTHRFQTDSDHTDREEAAKRVHYLNGGRGAEERPALTADQVRVLDYALDNYMEHNRRLQSAYLRNENVPEGARKFAYDELAIIDFLQKSLVAPAQAALQK